MTFEFQVSKVRFRCFFLELFDFPESDFFLRSVLLFNFCWFSIVGRWSKIWWDTCVMELRGSRLIWKLRESHLYQKWRWWLHYHPLIFFSATTSLGIANLKLFFMYVLKTFFTHFGSFFHHLTKFDLFAWMDDKNAFSAIHLVHI